jgi:hypothetical protein
MHLGGEVPEPIGGVSGVYALDMTGNGGNLGNLELCMDTVGCRCVPNSI